MSRGNTDLAPYVPVVFMPEPMQATAAKALELGGKTIARRGDPLTATGLVWVPEHRDLFWVTLGAAFAVDALAFDGMTGMEFAAFAMRVEAQLRGFVA